MRTDWVADIRTMHETFFGSLERKVMEMTPELRREFFLFRLRFLREELEELAGADTPEDVVDALVDLCVVAIGTMDAFGVHAHEAWQRVLRANMAKRPGVKPGRVNPFGLPDLIKPVGWVGPCHEDNTGLLGEVFNGSGS